jgi:sugar (pentulose or hexulose) kinase
VDAGAGYGTNLADIRSGTWSQAAMDVAAPGLQEWLPRLVIQDSVIGRISAYMVNRFGFNPAAEVVVGSGDNPCSLDGFSLRRAGPRIVAYLR